MPVSHLVKRLRWQTRKTLPSDETGIVTLTFLNDLYRKELG